MKETFVPKRFSSSSMDIINKANEIIKKYLTQGYHLTLRQLYYQFVSRRYLPNIPKSYKRLGSIINDARLAGLIDWDIIDDLTRSLHGRPSWDNPSEIVEACINGYHIDRWRFASNYVEVWVEKEALSNIVSRATYEYDVPYISCKGYPSQTIVYKAANRFKVKEDEGRDCFIIYLGDHDPSGVDITRDIQDRLSTFGANCEVNRIALNMEQIEMYNPPPNPAKLTDSRATDYIAKFGNNSWELDALEPKVLHNLIQSNIKMLIDWDEMDKSIKLENKGKKILKKALSFINNEIDNKEEDHD